MFPLNLVKSEANHLSSRRECGPCTACCLLPRISPTEDRAFPHGKPGYTPCEHLDLEGHKCNVYSKRPGLCRDYSCLWRMGVVKGDDSRRPDRLGIMFVLDELRGKLCVEAWELWDGAASDHTARWIIESIAEQYPIAIRPYGVPCSHQFRGVENLALARTLSELSRIDPVGLARWLEARVADGTLEMPPDSTAWDDLNSLREGVPVQRYYKRPE